MMRIKTGYLRQAMKKVASEAMRDAKNNISNEPMGPSRIKKAEEAEFEIIEDNNPQGRPLSS